MDTKAVTFITLLLFASCVQGVGEGDRALYEAYQGLKEFGVEDAWSMGYTGRGVKVAVVDSGIDFATPDLIGTQARVENASSPYNGWPIVIDLRSLQLYQKGSSGYGSQYADTSSTDTKGYKTTGTSKSGVYHIGDHPDRHLANYYNESVKVLLADEHIAGVYDTVYVDLNDNHDFRDDKPCRKGDEVAYHDIDKDGYPDISGGMVYFIAGGETPLPLSKMLYGNEAKIPENGSLVAFHLDPSAHGTMCASTIAAQGKNVKGIAPDARLIPVRDFGGDEMLTCLITSLGYDGLPDTGDEADVISRSGSAGYLTRGADKTSAFLEYLTTEISPHTTLIFANGNSGSGYGTCGSPSSKHVINAGAIYDMWWKNSLCRGEVTSFSSRGPNVLGQAKPNVLATGYYAPESKPLWLTHSGKAAWDAWGGGTSDAAPHVAGVVALIYQCYKDTYGEFPISEKARDILMSSATDTNDEVFAQGAGIINAKRAVEIIKGENGALVEPALITSEPVEAGSVIEKELTVFNYYGEPIELKPMKLVRTRSVEFTASEGVFQINKELLDCDLLRISSYYERDERDTKARGDGYVLSLYNWDDRNRDGESSEDELDITAKSNWSSGYTCELRMTEPEKKVNDGLFYKVEQTGKCKEPEIVIECFEWKLWDAVDLSVEGDLVHCRIKTPEATGVYQGKISVGDQCIPVSFATYMKDEIRMVKEDGPYDNARIYGRFEGESKDRWETRLYPIYHEGDDALAIVEVEWDDPEADIDGFLLNYGSAGSSDVWSFPAPPPVELPEFKTLKVAGSTAQAYHPYTEVSFGTISGVYEYSYNVFHTSTGKNRDVFSGILRKGLNVIELIYVVPGSEYGTDVKLDVRVETLPEMNMTCRAGERIRLPYGPSRGEKVSGFEEKKLDGKKGDVFLFSSDSEYILFFDSDGDGVLDWESDETIFGTGWNTGKEMCEIYHVLPINKDGVYFFVGSGDLYRLKPKRSIFPVEAPEKAGTYMSAIEKDGVLLPITLTVEPAEVASVAIKAPERVGCGIPFDVELETLDKFGNHVNINGRVALKLEGSTSGVELINGKGKAILKAPDTLGRYKIKTNSAFGLGEAYIETTKEPIVELTNVSVNSDGMDISLRNSGGSEFQGEICANPNLYLLPGSLEETPPEMKSLCSYKSILSYSLNSTVLLPSGTIQQLSLPFKAEANRSYPPEVFPYIIVIRDNKSVVAYEMIPESSNEITSIEGLKDITDMKRTSVNEPLSFKSKGLVSVQLNDLPPLFFITYGAITIFPDEAGELEVIMDGESYTISVLEKEMPAIEKPPENEKPEKRSALPKVQSLKATSSGSTIKLSWRAVEKAHHYNVYRHLGDSLTKIADVNVPEYMMEGEPWTSYTFRISAVDKNGNEGELSDPAGIVPMP